MDQHQHDLSASDLLVSDEETFYVELIQKQYRVWKYVNSGRAELDVRAAIESAQL